MRDRVTRSDLLSAQRTITEELTALTDQVQRQRGYGRRQARRFVGRRANIVTLAVWRKTGQFPIGFRRGSKR